MLRADFLTLGDSFAESPGVAGAAWERDFKIDIGTELFEEFGQLMCKQPRRRLKSAVKRIQAMRDDIRNERWQAQFFGSDDVVKE